MSDQVSPEAKHPKARAYQAPEILWERTFIALAQVTQPMCHPGDPPPCP
jgi:hypothetical protein